MPVHTDNRIDNRVEHWTADLTPAVQAGQGARFSLLLSLISVKQQYRIQEPPVFVSGSQFRLQAPLYPDPNTFYTDGLTERLNRAVSEQHRGEFALLCSYVDTASRMPRRNAERFEQVARITGAEMRDRVEQSRVQVAA